MTENTLKLIYIDFKIFKNSYKNTFRPSFRHLTGKQKAQMDFGLPIPHPSPTLKIFNSIAGEAGGGGIINIPFNKMLYIPGNPTFEELTIS